MQGRDPTQVAGPLADKVSAYREAIVKLSLKTCCLPVEISYSCDAQPLHSGLIRSGDEAVCCTPGNGSAHVGSKKSRAKIGR
jgi:hypothetical protein